MNEPELEIFYEGMEKFKKWQYEAAAELFERSVRLRPHAKTYLMLYECCMKLNRTDRAFKCIESSYRENRQGDKISYEYAKMLLWYKGDTNGALEILADIIGRNPDYKKARALDRIIRLQRQDITWDCSVMFIEEFKTVSDSGEGYIYMVVGADGKGCERVLDVHIAGEPAEAVYDDILGGLKSRGAEGISIVCHGCPGVISGAVGKHFPGAVCIIPPGKILKNICSRVRYKDRKIIRSDIEKILLSPTAAVAEKCIENFSKKWCGTYPDILMYFGLTYEQIISLFGLTQGVRRELLSLRAAEKCCNAMDRSINSAGCVSDDDIIKIVYKSISEALGSSCDSP